MIVDIARSSLLMWIAELRPVNISGIEAHSVMTAAHVLRLDVEQARSSRYMQIPHQATAEKKKPSTGNHAVIANTSEKTETKPSQKRACGGG